jgi:pyrroloquinoline quinone (PQQ) biosynthesis protein C
MNAKEWRAKMGEIAREWVQSPEIQSFRAVKFTPAKAKLYLTQLNHYVRNRRHCWSNVMANSPIIEVKQRILDHEYEEMVQDEYSDAGHLDLVYREAKEVGLSQEQLLSAPALPITQACTNGWLWIAAHRPWQASLAASSAMELENDSRLLHDLGEGTASHMLKVWSRDLGFKPEQMPNMAAHSKADEKHSEMFLEIFERHVPPHMQQLVLDTAKESFAIYGAYYAGLAAAMNELS